MSEDYADILAEHDKMYEETEVKERSYLPDGIYQASIIEARVEKSNNGDLQLVMTFQAESGPFKGATIRKYYYLEEERGIGFVKQDMHTLNFDLMKLSDLPMKTDFLIGKCAEIKVQHKDVPRDDGSIKTYVNVYINKLIQTDSNYIDPPPVGDDYPF